jgi:hypothetical protein
MWQSTCVKFSKAETRELAFFGVPLWLAAISVSNRLCSMIPGAVLSWGCTGLVGPYGGLLVNSMRGAANEGKCVEMHFYRFGPVPPWWKTEGC